MARVARLPTIDRAEDAERRRVPLLRTRYYAFLSYSHKDRELADWLHRELEKFRVPHSLAGKLTANGVVPRRLTPIFRDQQDLSAGGDLAEEIKAALAASQFLIVLCSPEAAKSRWTNQEIESFKRTRPEGCVLAAVAAGEPFASEIPGRESEECFPPALRYKYDRRGHQTEKRAEPLASDFRDEGEGRRLALLKLVAGMLGVGLDELVQRETTRRHRQMAWLAAASLAGMAVTSTLAVFAVQSRNEAREQRREAEGLVAFMLGDLKDKLEPIGRLDALDGVGSRVLAYYSKQDASELTDAALIQRSRALSLTAQVAFLRGHLPDAERLYREAEAGTGEAVRRNPGDAQRLFDHAQNVFWIGELARNRGDTREAEAGYREYKRLADRMVEIEPDNLRWRMEVQYARENLGIVLLNQRRFADAAVQFAAGEGPMENLASVDPGNIEYRKELSNILAWLADTQRALGQLDAAIATRQKQINFLDRLRAGGKTDVDIQKQLIPAHQALGILLTSKGSPVEGIQELRAAVDQADRLIPVEPTNALWRTLAASARLELAKTLLSTGQGEEASSQTAIGCSMVSTLQVGDPNPFRTRALQSDCLAMRSRVALASGDSRGATNFAQQAIASARTERSGDPILDRYRIASAYRLLGDARKKAGDSSGAGTAWTQGLAALPNNVPERPVEMYERQQLLERAGRRPEARPLAARLAGIGYHSVI